MQQKGRAGMGSRKHGRSGKAPKSPRLRHRMQIEANRQRKLRPKKQKMYGSVKELLEGKDE